MIYIPDCAMCKHSYLKCTSENTKMRLACEAYPDGIPYDFVSNASLLDECANGIGYDPIERDI